MEIREYDTSYDLLNQHLWVQKISCWKFTDEFFKDHIAYFAKHKLLQNHYNNTNTYIINVNYQPFGTTYYHVLTEVLPNAIFLLEIINNTNNANMPILVPESKFDIKNPIIFKLDKDYNFLKQQTTECGFPSPQKIISLRNIIDKKVEYKKEIGVYIYRKEDWRQIRNSDEVFDIIKKKFNTINIFSRAKIIIAPHGAGLTNMIFSPLNIIIIEIMPLNVPNMCYWHQSCILTNKHYIYPEKYISQTDKNFNINIDEFKKALMPIIL